MSPAGIKPVTPAFQDWLSGPRCVRTALRAVDALKRDCLLYFARATSFVVALTKEDALMGLNWRYTESAVSALNKMPSVNVSVTV